MEKFWKSLIFSFRSWKLREMKFCKRSITLQSFVLRVSWHGRCFATRCYVGTALAEGILYGKIEKYSTNLTLKLFQTIKSWTISTSLMPERDKINFITIFSIFSRQKLYSFYKMPGKCHFVTHIISNQIIKISSENSL